MTRARKPHSVITAIVCSFALLTAMLLAPPANAATLVVSATDDNVDGDTSSPTALIANPGPDGTISLREALLAANNAVGPHTITFAPALAGQTIALTTRFAPITRDQITITGLTTNTGLPNITLDPSNASNPGAIFFVAASSFAMTGLRFTSIPVNFNGIQIGGSGFSLMGQPISSPPRISGFQISNNLFINGTGNNTFAIFVVPDTFNSTINTIANITIANNTFSQLFEAINISAPGNNNLIEDVVIYGNTFSQSISPATSAVELGAGGNGNQVRRTRILQNIFSNNLQGIVIDINGSSSNNLVDDTLIARNVFTGNLQALGVVAGVDPTTANNVVVNTRIIDNIINLNGFNGQGSVTIQVTDSQNGGTNNRVIGVSFVNNTVNSSGPSGPPGAGFWVTSSGGVSGIAISNTIFGGNPGFVGVSSSQVQYSITCQSGFSGINNNICTDPLFVNSAGGDFHLQPGSPAIGAGTHTGAPFGDLECKVRASPPAIGAYELGNNPSCTQIIPLSAVLPASRSVQVGNLASAFASIINPGAVTGNACGLVPSTSLPASFVFQTTDPATNQLTGTPNTPVNIAAGATQTYVFGFTPSGAFAPTDVALEFTCANTLDAATHVGLNTLLTSGSTTPVPDLIAIGATPSNDGIVDIPGMTGTGVFATAAVNIGASGTITATGDDGGTGLPVSLSICQTNPNTGQCINPVTPGPSATVSVSQNQTVTFTVFATGTGTVPFDPANNRLFLRLKDGGGLTRGATSVAVRTQ